MRDTNISLSGRSIDNGQIIPASTGSNSGSHGQAEQPRIFDQAIQVTADANADNHTSRIHDRYEINDTVGTKGQGQGHSMRSNKDTPQGHPNDLNPLVIHWKGTSNDGSSSSSKAMDTTPSSVEERSPLPIQFMDSICFTDGPSKGGPDMVDQQTTVMEWTELDSTTTRGGSLN